MTTSLPRPVLWRGDGTLQAGIAPPTRSPSLEGRHVRVRGLTAMGLAAVETLVRAGVAGLCLVDRSTGDDAWAADDAVAGVVPTRAQAAAHRVHAVAPVVRVMLDDSRAVDGEIVVAYGAPDPRVAHALALGGPHVALLADEAGATVLPVIPGVTACLRCHGLDRVGRDPSWPVLARQCEAIVPDVDPATAAVAGALAAACLAHAIDGRGTGRWRVTAGLPARDPLPADPSCGCGAA